MQNMIVCYSEDGVAYFDDRDAPMVILRGAVKPALLSEAGVPMDRRFTFFDQARPLL